jgi:hypothetical protein
LHNITVIPKIVLLGIGSNTYSMLSREAAKLLVRPQTIASASLSDTIQAANTFLSLVRRLRQSFLKKPFL